MALILAAFLIVSSNADAQLLPSGIENPLTTRFPELLAAPAPSWLAEGARATYSVLASNSEAEHLDAKVLSSGSVGNGINQLDVVGLENGQAAVLNVAYAPGAGVQGYVSAAGVQGALRPLLETGSVTPVGCGDFWANPTVLQGIPAMADNGGLTVQRLPYTAADGESYQAIRFDFINNDLNIALVYDLNTGILLYHTLDYLSFNPIGPNEVPTSGGRNAIYQFLNLRAVPMPWKDGRLPATLAAGDVLNYQGQMTIQIQGASPVTTPMALQISVLAANDRFADAKLVTYDQSTGSTSTTRVVRGVAGLMGNWIPKEAIAALRPGVIDTDPYTGMKISVVQNDANGAVFEKTNQQDFRELFSYNPGGELTQAYYEYNPDVMTSSGFGSVKTIILELV